MRRKGREDRIEKRGEIKRESKDERAKKTKSRKQNIQFTVVFKHILVWKLFQFFLCQSYSSFFRVEAIPVFTMSKIFQYCQMSKLFQQPLIIT